MAIGRMPLIVGALAMFGMGLAFVPVAAPADAQYSSYNRTRSTMNYRAASRAAARAAELRRYCRAHPKAARCAALKAKKAR